MTRLVLDDFAGCVGEMWQASANDRTTTLRLESARAIPDDRPEDGGFNLEWSGPADVFLPQGTYRFQRGSTEADIFIVPIGHTVDGFRYEAIFN